MSDHSHQFSLLDSELTLAELLKGEGVSPRLFDGMTSLEERKAAARIAIVMRRLKDKRLSTGESYAELFERLYREPLVKPQEGKT